MIIKLHPNANITALIYEIEQKCSKLQSYQLTVDVDFSTKECKLYLKRQRSDFNDKFYVLSDVTNDVNKRILARLCATCGNVIESQNDYVTFEFEHPDQMVEFYIKFYQ